jgi:hypothetical protein
LWLAWRTVQRAADSLGVKREKSSFSGGWQWRFPRSGGEDASRRCQPPQEQENLASWHLRENQQKNGHLERQPAEDAKAPPLGIFDRPPPIPGRTDATAGPAAGDRRTRRRLLRRPREDPPARLKRCFLSTDEIGKNKDVLAFLPAFW